MNKLALAPRLLTHEHHLYQGAGDVKVVRGFYCVSCVCMPVDTPEGRDGWRVHGHGIGHHTSGRLDPGLIQRCTGPRGVRSTNLVCLLPVTGH